MSKHFSADKNANTGAASFLDALKSFRASAANGGTRSEHVLRQAWDAGLIASHELMRTFGLNKPQVEKIRSSHPLNVDAAVLESILTHAEQKAAALTL